MFIQTETTPNPATLKFLPGHDLISTAPVDCPTAEDAARLSPLAERVFMVDGVIGVMIGVDSIAVTKSDDVSWDVLKLQVMGVLVEHLSRGYKVVYDGEQKPQVGAETFDDSIEGQIQMLIQTRVRPVVAKDGGDIVFDHYEDGIVYLRMKGACAGCPSATITLKRGVESMLKAYVPDVIAVKQVA